MGESGLVRSRVAHNTLLNFLGLAVPLALAFFVMPVAARHLGPARFGLLGLAWAITEYLTLFDLGLGRAIVKFVADALHHDSAELSEIVSVSLYAQLAAGIVGGAAFALAAPALVHSVFRLPPETARRGDRSVSSGRTQPAGGAPHLCSARDSRRRTALRPEHHHQDAEQRRLALHSGDRRGPRSIAAFDTPRRPGFTSRHLRAIRVRDSSGASRNSLGQISWNYAAATSAVVWRVGARFQ